MAPGRYDQKREHGRRADPDRSVATAVSDSPPVPRDQAPPLIASSSPSAAPDPPAPPRVAVKAPDAVSSDAPPAGETDIAGSAEETTEPTVRVRWPILVTDRIPTDGSADEPLPARASPRVSIGAPSVDRAAPASPDALHPAAAVQCGWPLLVTDRVLPPPRGAADRSPRELATEIRDLATPSRAGRGGEPAAAAPADARSGDARSRAAAPADARTRPAPPDPRDASGSRPRVVVGSDALPRGAATQRGEAAESPDDRESSATRRIRATPTPGSSDPGTSLPVGGAIQTQKVHKTSYFDLGSTAVRGLADVLGSAADGPVRIETERIEPTRGGAHAQTTSASRRFGSPGATGSAAPAPAAGQADRTRAHRRPDGVRRRGPRRPRDDSARRRRRARITRQTRTERATRLSAREVILIVGAVIVVAFSVNRLTRTEATAAGPASREAARLRAAALAAAPLQAPPPVERPWTGVGGAGMSVSAPPTRAEISSPRPAVRRDAVSRLAGRGAGAVPDLVKALTDDDLGVRTQAERSLRRLHHRLGVDVFAEIVRAIRAAEGAQLARLIAGAAAGGADAVSTLARYTEGDNDDHTRILAVEALGRTDASSAAGPLQASLADPNPVVRSRAAIALGRVGGRSSVPVLIARLRDRSLGVRTDAAWALERITGQKLGASHARWASWWNEGVRERWASLERLLATFPGLSARQQVAALQRLGGLRDRRVEELAQACLWQPAAGLRRQAADTIALQGPRALRSVPYLIRALGDVDAEVRLAAHRALIQLTGQRFAPVPLTWAQWWDARS